MDIVEHKINQIIENYRQQIDQLEKLKRSLAHNKQDAVNRRPTISLNPDSIKRLRKLYGNAVMNEQETFLFDGQEMVTNYAKYVLEYYDSGVKAKHRSCN